MGGHAKNLVSGQGLPFSVVLVKGGVQGLGAVGRGRVEWGGVLGECEGVKWQKSP